MLSSPLIRNLQRVVLPAVLLTLFLCGVGCGKRGPECGEIRGEVRLDGQPLERGSILLAPIEGTKGVVTGGQIDNGLYQLSGANGPAVGWNRVEIRAVRKTGKMVQKPMAPQGEMTEEMAEAIPPQYNSTSTLKVEVVPGENVADFDLQSR